MHAPFCHFSIAFSTARARRAMLQPAEAAAQTALTALKDAAIIRSTKADWRLVAAAQAMRSRTYSDEFDAAAAFGKTIAQRREVSDWTAKLADLERRQTAPRRSSRLLVRREWREASAECAVA